jgi:mRNA interferase RelE/StbE
MTDVEYTEQALEHLEALDPQVADQVMNKVDEATNFTEHRLDPPTNYDYYKIRAGDWRAIIT